MPEAFDQPRRQELLGLVLFFAENLRRFVRILFGLIAGAAVSPKFLAYAWIAVVAGVLINAAFSYMQYRRFLFHVEDGALKISKGVFLREKIDIPFERIQTVHLHQNIIQRLLSLTGVKVDTAGSGKKELQIHALKRSDARLLQTYLGSAQPGAAPPSSDQTDAPTLEAPDRTESEPLVRLSLGRLLIVGLTQNHIRNGLVAIGFIAGTFSQLDEWIGALIDDVSEETIQQAKAGAAVMIVMGVVTFALASVLFSVVQVILKYYGLVAYLNDRCFTITAGLLKRNEHTVPLTKVQFLEWKGNFLRAIPGFETVRVFQARSQENIPGALNVSIPAVFTEQTERILATLYGDTTPKLHLRPHPAQRVLMALYCMIPLAIAAIPLSIGGQFVALAITAAVYVPLCLFWTGRYHRSVDIATNGRTLVYKRGWAFTQRTVMEVHKVQSVSLHQNFLHRRRGVAHLTLHTAGGKRTLRFLPESDARALSDYALYRVSAHPGSWM